MLTRDITKSDEISVDDYGWKLKENQKLTPCNCYVVNGCNLFIEKEGIKQLEGLFSSIKRVPTENVRKIYKN